MINTMCFKIVAYIWLGYTKWCWKILCGNWNDLTSTLLLQYSYTAIATAYAVTVPVDKIILDRAIQVGK